MYKKIVHVIITLIFSFACFALQAQDSAVTEKPQMAEAMRSNGKIYVVIAVLITILFGILLYVVNLDRKISKLEKEV
jgi:CcmD family protein